MSFWIAGASVVAGVGGAALGANAAKKAAKAGQAGTDESIAEQRRQFDLVRSDTAGQRAIGNGALSTLARLYGYGPMPTAETGGYASANPLSASLPKSQVLGGSWNPGGQLTQKLGGAAQIFDPAAALFGSKHGDERRNLQAFMADNDLRDLGNGMVGLPDGRSFSKDQLQSVAGAYYGARYHPDGDQSGWQQKFDSMLTAAPAQPEAAAGGPQTPAGPDMSAFFTSPDYQFRQQEGQKAIDRSASARGGLLSGGAEKAGIRYASNLASGEFGSFVDRLFQQAGIGSTGIGASAAAGANASSNISNAYTNNAANKGNAYLAGASAINSGLQGTASNLLLQKYLYGNGGVGRPTQANNFGYGPSGGVYG